MTEFLEVASEELAEAAAYYEARRAGLGERFLLEVRRAVLHIEERPEIAPRILHAKIPEGVRRVLVDSFPYGVVYVEPEMVVVAIAHLKRRPKYWVRRLRHVYFRA